MGIKISEAAAQRASSFLQNRGSGLGLRLGVKTTGCSGLAYVLEFVDEMTTFLKIMALKSLSMVKAWCT